MLALLAIVYVLFMVAISFVAQRRVHDVEDFVVAGRRLGLPLATGTLLATWYGAGTLLTSADEISERGLQPALLDPWGAGACLLLAGLFYAGPLWRMGLTTLPDLFRTKFGSTAEVLSAVLMVPTYFGWVAAQFLALGAMVQLLFGWSSSAAVLAVALVGTGYTLVGGMWAVTLTDALQVVLMTLGLGVLTWAVAADLGPIGGPPWAEAFRPERLSVVDDGTWGALAAALGVFAAGSLGNLPSQDLLQRIFAARSESTARMACLTAGILYVILGTFPIFLGLVGPQLGVGGQHDAVLPALAAAFLDPVVSGLFLITIVSAVLSTIDSAILAPAVVLSENVVARIGWGNHRPLRRNRIMVAVVGGLSLVAAYSGEDAYGLLESAYELGLVSLLAPMTYALFGQRPDRTAALASMLVGTVTWGAHQLAGAARLVGTGIPIGLAAAGLSFAVLPVVAGLSRRDGSDKPA